MILIRCIHPAGPKPSCENESQARWGSHSEVMCRREAAARRQQIPKGACECFLTRGGPGSTADEIARPGELAKGILYLYFSSKEEITFSPLLNAIEDLLRNLEAALDPCAAAAEA